MKFKILFPAISIILQMICCGNQSLAPKSTINYPPCSPYHPDGRLPIEYVFANENFSEGLDLHDGNGDSIYTTIWSESDFGIYISNDTLHWNILPRHAGIRPIFIILDDKRGGKDTLFQTFYISNPWHPNGAKEYTTEKGMRKIIASGYSFIMGAPYGNTYGGIDMPPQQVAFTYNYFMDTSEVTQGEYFELMAKTPWKNVLGFNLGEGPEYPANNVNWYEAVLFCNQRSKRDGFDTVYNYTGKTFTRFNEPVLEGLKADTFSNGYRLPTEAEWEYACRGGTITDFYWQYKTLTDKYAVCASKAGIQGYEKVCSRLPNNYGLFDMSGNVSEWCNDYYASYTEKSVVDSWGPDSSMTRVIRGGDYFNCFLESSFRDNVIPSQGVDECGFRCVRRCRPD